MVEIINPQEFEARWDQHSFDDQCSARPVSVPLSSNAELLRATGAKMIAKRPAVNNDLLVWQTKELSQARNRLTEFLDTADISKPIDVIGKGKKFDLKDWPKGTIMKLHATRATRNAGEQEEMRLAVLAQARTRVGSFLDRLIILPAEAMTGEPLIPLIPLVGLDPSAAFRPQSTLVGRVEHFRYTGLASENDLLVRYNSIQILQLGTAQREIFGSISRTSPRKQKRK